MIKAKITPSRNVLIVFDVPQHKAWSDYQRITLDGLGGFVTRLMNAGLDPAQEVSIVCLADSKGAKAKDFKAKQEYIQDVIESNAFNVVVPVGAKAFEKIMGHKGIERYFGKTLRSEVYDCKVIPCPTPSMVRFKPEIADVLVDTVRLIQQEKESAEIIEVEKLPTKYFVIDTIAKFDKLIEVFTKAPVFSYDLETTGFRFNADEILTLQFTHKVGFSYLIPSNFYKNPDGSAKFWKPSEWEYIKGRIKALFAQVRGPNKKVIGHNLKFDLKFTAHHLGIDIPPPENLVDTMVMSFLIDENTPNDLKYLTCIHTDMGDYEFDLMEWKDNYCKSQKPKMKKGDFSYGLIPFDILVPYAQADTDATLRLYETFLPLMDQEEQWGPFDMLMKFLYTTTHMEMVGWPVDLEYAHEYLRELNVRIAEKEAALLRHPHIKSASKVLAILKLKKDNEKRKSKLTKLKDPFVFNLRSNDQKRVLFFDIMGLPAVKYTKAVNAEGKRTTPSMDKEVIEEWSNTFPKHAAFFEQISDYADLCKMRSTYVEALIKKQVNGRIYPTYNIVGAKTGRLSSRDPNFQNIPAHSDEAKKVKRIIAPQEPGWVMIGADLGAAEMRYACLCSDDEKLKEIFNSGVDIHGAIAKEIFNLDCDANEVKFKYPELRNIAKTVQFLSLYGGGADTLATKVKIKPKRAKQILQQIAEEVGLTPDADGFYELRQLAGNPDAIHSLVDKFQFSEAKARKVLAARNQINALMDGFTITTSEAQTILDNYFAKYAGVDRYIKATIAFAKKFGHSLSLLGRKRRVPAVKSEDKGVVERGVRQAVNSTIQSIASDGLMLSAFNLLRYLQENNENRLRIMGPIHDAIYCEVREDFLHEARDLIIKFMSQFPEGLDAPIPMESDAEWGPNWKEFSEDFGEDLTVGAGEERDEDKDEEEEAKAA